MQCRKPWSNYCVNEFVETSLGPIIAFRYKFVCKKGLDAIIGPGLSAVGSVGKIFLQIRKTVNFTERPSVEQCSAVGVGVGKIFLQIRKTVKFYRAVVG